MSRVRAAAVATTLLMTSGGLLVLGAPLADAATDVTATATATVNIRSGPGTSHAVVGGLVRGQRITATSKAKAGWVRVRFDGGSAYMSASYLALTGEKAPAAPKSISTKGTKITTETVNVRSGAGATHSIVGTFHEGSDLTLTGKLSAGYAQVRYGSALRWVSITYLASSTKSAAAPAPTAPAVPTPVPSGTKGEQALAFAKTQLGKPYKYGATGPKAYDCSGLVLAAWRSAGVSLPRTSSQQFHAGTKISKSQLRPGDLVFFYGSRPSHVALYVGDGIVLHSPRPGKHVEYIKMKYMPYSGARRPG